MPTGWDRTVGTYTLLAIAYYHVGRPRDSAKAMQQALRLSLPIGDEYAGLRELLNPAMQLKEGVSLDDFKRAAAKLGLGLAVQTNGIDNTYWQSIGNGTAIASELAATGKPAVVMNIYNPTHGGIRDSVETGLQIFGLDTAAVGAMRLAVSEADMYNRAMFGADTHTIVFGHSQGTAIANEAVSGLNSRIRGRVELYNFGTATGHVPFGLAKYRSVENLLDPVPMVVGNVVGRGGVETSPGFITGKITGRDYEVIHTAFDVPGSRTNHSLSPYFSDIRARSGLGFGSLTPQLRELYSTGAWVREH